MKTSFGILHIKWVIQLALRCLLQETGHYENSFIFSEKHEMMDWLNAGNSMPDILFIGSDLVNMIGPDVAKEIRKKYPGTLPIGICRPNKLKDINFMINGGCYGCICSDDRPSDILQSTKDVLQHRYMKNKPNDYFNAHNALQEARVLLNDEEIRLAGQLCTTKSPKDLALEEHVSLRKYQRMEGDLYKVLNVKSRVELIIKVKDEDIIL